ncbi:MAG: class I poly(R)-hydroxyalkanoic acid synthase [Alphaproteobacteria bacterium]|nr:class I poly(R)-hydroxyalkanoic acid synthase [Alphaproteobacteria bacterium]
MNKPEGTAESRAANPSTKAEELLRVAAQSQRIVTEFLTRRGAEGHLGTGDPMNIGKAFFEMTTKLLADPSKMAGAQISLWQSYMALWQHTAQRLMGGELPAPLHEPAADDRRFRDPVWSENAVFDFIKQSYLLTARWLQSTVSEVSGLDEKTAKKVDFYTRQFVDALAPTNFALTNPTVLRETIESRGENLLRGLKNLLDDIERGEGKLAISMTDQSAFELGKNVAVSPGKVVYQNDLIQLIQYEPTTETVHRCPLLIVPPWINKYYVLDLQPKNSFVRYAVAQGYTTFVVSWVNPDERLSHKSFEDYMSEGILDALDAMERATGETESLVIGYCLGGTLLASTLAYMATKGDTRIKAATFFATLVDFKNPGELGVFIDEEQLNALETRMDKKGYLEGRDMATSFNMLRANDLIWSFVVNNYLLGKDPFPFDLLFWNADSTRMPAEMHKFYLRKMYQENKLVEPGGITLCDTPIDLRKITLPVYILAAREDHIAPWASTFEATKLYQGPVRFVLSGSGHIAGIANPPEAKKYGYYTGATKPNQSAEAWLEAATQFEGSWWPDWDKFAAEHGGSKVPARKPGDGKLKVIEAAPGSYAKVRA